MQHSLLNICGVTSNNQTIQLGVAWLPNEQQSVFERAFLQLRKLLTSHESRSPNVIVHDRQITAIKAIDNVFPEVQHIICRWHMKQNVQAWLKAKISRSAFETAEEIGEALSCDFDSNQSPTPEIFLNGGTSWQLALRRAGKTFTSTSMFTG